MKSTRVIAMAAFAAACCLTATTTFAQAQSRPDQGRRDQNRPDQGGRPDRGRFDPAQMRERMMERYKDVLEIKDDAEWKAVQPLIQKVMDARMSSMGSMGRMFGRRPGDRGGENRPSIFGQTSPETETLERAIEAKAPNSELKTAIAKYQEARKAKQSELEKAQNDLRKVLSVRQEALATLNGLL